jgi:hypothetical protein
MIIATWKDLRPLINKDISTGLIMKAWYIHDIRVRVGWIRFDKLEEHGIQYCNQNLLDPDTTLMIYQMPQDNPNGDPVSDEIFDAEIGGLTLGNHTTCVCCFYSNMTLNKLANSINQVCNLKAFL